MYPSASIRGGRDDLGGRDARRLGGLVTHELILARVADARPQLDVALGRRRRRQPAARACLSRAAIHRRVMGRRRADGRVRCPHVSRRSAM